MTVILHDHALTAVRLPPSAEEVLRTMHRQPADLHRLLSDGWKQARQAADLLDGAERLILTGVGSSYNAANMGAWLFRALGFDARAIPAGDIWLYPQNHPFRPTDAVIVLSHFGLRSAARETLNLARAAGSTVLSIGSLTVEHPGSRLILRTVERETSIVSTASHLAALFVMAQVALIYGERTRPAAVAGWRDALERLPADVAAMLTRTAEVTPVAHRAADRHILATAAGPNESTVDEFKAKAQQAGHPRADAVGIEQLIHGALLSAGRDDVGIVVRVPGSSAARTAEFSRAMRAIGMDVWVIGDEPAALGSLGAFALPDMPELLTPLAALIPLQLLAYQIAMRRQFDPHTFDRLVLLLP